METNDLFGGAEEIKKVGKTSSADRDTYEVKSKEIATAMKDFLEFKRLVDEYTAKFSIAEGIVKPYCKDKWLQILKEKGYTPENFRIRSEDGTELMFIVQRKYKSVKEERVLDLTESFGLELFKIDEEFVVNPAMIEKYGKQISTAIMSSKDIPEDDKKKIIQKKKKYSIASDVLDKIKYFADKAKVSFVNFFDEISPTIQLRK